MNTIVIQKTKQKRGRIHTKPANTSTSTHTRTAHDRGIQDLEAWWSSSDKRKKKSLFPLLLIHSKVIRVPSKSCTTFPPQKSCLVFAWTREFFPLYSSILEGFENRRVCAPGIALTGHHHHIQLLSIIGTCSTKGASIVFTWKIVFTGKILGGTVCFSTSVIYLTDRIIALSSVDFSEEVEVCSLLRRFLVFKKKKSVVRCDSDAVTGVGIK